MTYNFNNCPSDAMSISGKWTNIHNGKEIFVRDSFIDGDNMIVRTIDGNIIPMTEFSNNYVQSEEVDEATARSVIQQPVAPQSYGDIKPDFGEKVILKNDDAKDNNIKPSNLDQVSQYVENHKEDNVEDKLFRKKTLIGMGCIKKPESRRCISSNAPKSLKNLLRLQKCKARKVQTLSKVSLRRIRESGRLSKIRLRPRIEMSKKLQATAMC